LRTERTHRLQDGPSEDQQTKKKKKKKIHFRPAAISKGVAGLATISPGFGVQVGGEKKKKTPLFSPFPQKTPNPP